MPNDTQFVRVRQLAKSTLLLTEDPTRQLVLSPNEASQLIEMLREPYPVEPKDYAALKRIRPTQVQVAQDSGKITLQFDHVTDCISFSAETVGNLAARIARLVPPRLAAA